MQVCFKFLFFLLLFLPSIVGAFTPPLIETVVKINQDPKYLASILNDNCLEFIINETLIQSEITKGDLKLSIEDSALLALKTVPFKTPTTTLYKDFSKPLIWCHNKASGVWQLGFKSTIITISNQSVMIDNQTTGYDFLELISNTNTLHLYLPYKDVTSKSTDYGINSYEAYSEDCTIEANSFNNSPALYCNFDNTQTVEYRVDIINSHQTYQPFSILMWVKPLGINASAGGLFRTGNSDGAELELYIDDSNKTTYLAVSESIQSTTVLESNNWYHLGVVYDGNTSFLYVNGVLESFDNTTYLHLPDYAGEEPEIGISNEKPKTNTYFKNVRIYNDSLTATQLNNIFVNESQDINLSFITSGTAITPVYNDTYTKINWSSSEPTGTDIGVSVKTIHFDEAFDDLVAWYCFMNVDETDDTATLQDCSNRGRDLTTGLNVTAGKSVHSNNYIGWNFTNNHMYWEDLSFDNTFMHDGIYSVLIIYDYKSCNGSLHSNIIAWENNNAEYIRLGNYQGGASITAKMGEQDLGGWEYTSVKYKGTDPMLMGWQSNTTHRVIVNLSTDVHSELNTSKTDTANALRIGMQKNALTTASFNGTAYDILFFDKYLTPTERQRIYDQVLNWTTWTTTNTTNPHSMTQTGNYSQYRFTLNSTDNTKTPVLYNFTLSNGTVDGVPDVTPPSISIISPANNTVWQSNNSVTMILNSNESCTYTLYLNGTANETGSAIAGNTTFFFESENAFWRYNYSCTDGTNVGNTEFHNLHINYTPPDTMNPTVLLKSPADNSNATAYPNTFVCNITDNSGVKNLTLYLTDNASLNWALNETDNTLSGLTDEATFSKTLRNGNYTWNCLGYDESGNMDWGVNRTLFLNVTVLDLSPPNVTLNYPTWGKSITGLSTLFNCTAEDNQSNIASVTLYGNWSGDYIANATNSTETTNGTYYWRNVNMPEGSFVWNCYACDVFSNCGSFISNNTLYIYYPSTFQPLIESRGIEWLSLNFSTGGTASIQYSEDNITEWQTVTSVDNVLNKAYQINLQADTAYYFRAKNETTGWYYFKETTKRLEQSDYYYIYILFYAAFIILLIIAEIVGQPNNQIFKFMAGVILIISGISIINNSFDNLTNTFLKNGLAVINLGIGFYYILKPSLDYIESWGVSKDD